MRSVILPFRAALKTLVAASGLLLLLMVAVQLFPRLKMLSDRPNQLEAQEIAEVSEPQHSQRAKATSVESEAEDSFEESIEDHPRPRPEADWRIDELERHVRSLEKQLSEASSAHERLLQTATQRNEAQAAELSSMTIRLATAERLLQSVQQSKEPVESGGVEDPVQDDASCRIAIRAAKGDESCLVIEAREASLPVLFARLGEFAGVNVLVAPDVIGLVSLHLVASNVDDALDAVGRLHHCALEYKDDAIFVNSSQITDAGADASAKNPQTLIKLYRLQHIRGAELRPYVQMLLTPGVGAVAAAPDSKHAHADDPRALLVRDTPAVLAEVERLLQELDRGPTISPPELLPPIPAPAPVIAPQAPQPPLPPRPAPKYSRPPDMSWNRPAPRRPESRGDRDGDSRTGNLFKLSSLRDLMSTQPASHSELAP